jgi:uncharacterized membrane protein YgcG
MSYIRSVPIAALLVAASILGLTLGGSAVSAQDTGWTITSFDVSYEIYEDGTVAAVEDIRVDFGSLQRHGIFRSIPVEYVYDTDYNRLIELTDVAVDDGTNPITWRIDADRPNLILRIGDPDALVTGEQRYRISYTIRDGLNPFPTHDEFYWNATGNDWPVSVESASASVTTPGGIEQVTCFEGSTGSNAPCGDTTFQPNGAQFDTRSIVPPGSGLTIVVGLEKGAVQVGPPVLVPNSVDPVDEIVDFMGLKPLPIGIAIAGAVLGLLIIYRLWWTAGRDRWYGGVAHVIEGVVPDDIKPLGAHETIVVEYTPPEVAADGADSRRPLRPAEVGVLIDERADTLDVSATIIDLAVRRHLRIVELEKGSILGIFKHQDYELERLDNPDDPLLPFEERVYVGIFSGNHKVKLSELRNKFYKDLAKAKKDLYTASVRDIRFFPANPETVRNVYRGAGFAGLVGGAGLVFALGGWADAGIIGVAIALIGGVLLLSSSAMPRRTATGRRMYRRCLGFRLYMETAETDRQRFAENENIFHEYLPYAIVFECVHKWAKVFEDLGLQPQPDYYVGTHPFVPLSFAATMSSFSASVSTTMASTPGGSGGSGFGGGGFSGGGGGGGGGGSW